MMNKISGRRKRIRGKKRSARRKRKNKRVKGMIDRDTIREKEK